MTEGTLAHLSTRPWYACPRKARVRLPHPSPRKKRRGLGAPAPPPQPAQKTTRSGGPGSRGLAQDEREEEGGIAAASLGPQQAKNPTCREPRRPAPPVDGYSRFRDLSLHCWPSAHATKTIRNAYGTAEPVRHFLRERLASAWQRTHSRDLSTPPQVAFAPLASLKMTRG
jgi:hypothetical protein